MMNSGYSHRSGVLSLFPKKPGHLVVACSGFQMRRAKDLLVELHTLGVKDKSVFEPPTIDLHICESPKSPSAPRIC
jgi:hypothetical protein